MRKRQKKKREIRAEIRHAEFMRGMEKYQALIANMVILRSCVRGRFSHGGILPNTSHGTAVQINQDPINAMVQRDRLQQLLDLGKDAKSAEYWDGVKEQLAADMGACVDGEMLDKLKS